MQRKIINSVIKDTVTFIRTSKETNGKTTELELTLMPKGGNFPHYHKTLTETFTAIEGNLGLKLKGNKLKILRPNETYTVAVNEVHSFFNPSEKEIRFNVKIEPGSVGFENSLRILYGLAEEGLTNKKSIPKQLTHIAIIGKISDSYLPGFMKILTPLLNYLAEKAKKTGVEQQLVEKYCK
ncbi:cupin domain-containing protein [Pelobium sp.]|nr:cupin domain-containing protein [Pelobium sp.]MDA9554811.1 cupin domain-containing protein [Pelobium sp.]